MNPEDLQFASWRGVTFPVTESGITGGRRIIRKLFPNSDRQITEDLGLQPDEFSFSGTVAARRDNSGAVIQSYIQVRSALISAFKQKGPGVLIHPFLGRIENAVLISYTIRESTTSLGDSPLDLVFTTDDGSAVPQISESVVGSVSADSQSLLDRLVEGFTGLFNVTVNFIGNFTHATDMVDSFGSSIGSAVNAVVSDAEEIITFTEDLDSLSSQKAELVLDPAALASGVVNLVGNIFSIQEPQNAFDTLSKLFTFGDGFSSILPTTAGLIERQQNQSTFTGTIQAAALGQAYLAASDIEFGTTEDVDNISSLLEDQYQKVISAGTLDADSKDALTDLRSTTKKFFDQERDIRPQVIEVQTQLTTPRLLAYQYYGSDDLGETIGLLNRLSDSIVKPGKVKILSDET